MADALLLGSFTALLSISDAVKFGSISLSFGDQDSREDCRIASYQDANTQATCKHAHKYALPVPFHVPGLQN